MTFMHPSYKALLCLIPFLFFQFLPAQTHNNNYEEGKVFLKLKASASIELPSIESKSQAVDYPYFNDLLQKFNTHKLFKPFQYLKSKTFQNVYQIEFEDVKQISAFSTALKKYDIVEYIEPIPIDYTFSEPNDNYFGLQWHLDKIEAMEAWSMGVGSENIVVAVVDDAIKTTHEDLKNVIWTNQLELPNNGIDDDNNGFIDDYQGYDMADNDNNPNPPINSPFLRHGTHVTGIVAAQTNNELGVASIGNGIKILPIKATKDNIAPDKKGAKTQISHGWQGVSYAIEMNVDIINLSWGSNASSQTYQSLINEAHAKGIIVVAAAGNNGDSDKVYPAAYEHVIAVAATSHDDTKLGISSYGNWVDISAPGETIISTSSTTNSAYENNTGTSMASPMVAGLLGLMWSYDRSVLPEDLLDCMFSNADPISMPQFNKSMDMGAGRINANQAMKCLIPPSICETPNPPVVVELETHSVIMAWETTNSTQYKLAYKISGLNNVWIYNEINTPATTLNDLTPNTNYIVKVASVCDESISEYSPIIYFTTLPEVIPCNPPTNITNNELNNTTARFNWENTGDNRYQVAYKLGSATSWMYSETNIPNINLEGLEPNSSYTLKVASICGEIVSEYSSNIYFTTEPTPCYSPSQPKIEELSDITATIHWESSNTDRFRVAYSLTASISWTYVDVSVSLIDLKNLTPESSYTFKVASICGESISNYTNPIQFTTEPMPCRSPFSPTLNELTESSVVFSWEGEFQNTYRVAFKSLTSLNWSYFNSETTNLYISDLVSNTTYQLKVASICGEILSDYTEPINFTTTKAECPIPIDIRTNLVGSQKVKVSWSVESDNYLGGYIIRYRPEGTEIWQKKTSSTTSILIGFLRANESYELQVSATCTEEDVGKILFSETIFFKTRNLHEPTDIKDPIGTAKRISSHIFTTPKTYPSPSHGRFSVQFYQETTAAMTLQVYDLSGKIIYSKLLETSKGDNRFEIDLSNQPKGKYFLQLSHDSNVHKQSILLF